MFSLEFRRLRTFSLRALLVITAVVSVGLGWARHTVVERQSAKRTWQGDQNVMMFPSRRSVSWFRRCFGDEAMFLISFPDDYSPSEFERATRLFPEANVVRRGPGIY